MPFTDEQLTQLAAPLEQQRIAQRQQAGRTLDYLEGYDVIDAANHIFGYDGWSYEVTGLRDMAAESSRPLFEARVRAQVEGVVREDVGVGIAANQSPDAVETAIKGAVTDALKRALRTFGNQFGNSLYDKQHESPPAPVAQPETAERLKPRPVAPATASGKASEPQVKYIKSLLHQVEEGAALAIAGEFGGISLAYDQDGKMHVQNVDLTMAEGKDIIDRLLRAKVPAQ